ncbi:class I SAM-dependent methyltransferase [Williamsia muralis]|uniref:SAM-dependent methyltransferase n=1 Tax=Williamsia marianensis TaxID=85044 RepID=A0ABU4EXF5_WILMA|nr:hypothetical protein [Williamsia muralis]MDV7135916.1 hypothetical protein [Williamsia muralis]
MSDPRSMEKSLMTQPEAMAGGGQYNEHSTAQLTAAARALPLLRQAAAVVPPTSDGSLTIADYGCSEGRNSLAPMRAAIEEMRRVRPADTPISVVHTDLPLNDFSSLFATVADNPGTYAGTAVYTSAVGRSFYEHILPPRSVSLGWSSIALHWLSAAPGPLDSMWYTDGTQPQRDRWARQAGDDWARFLDARGRELLPGARLIIVVGSADAAGYSGAETVMATLRRVASDMAETGRLPTMSITPIPAWYRTTAEWHAPFPHAAFTLDHFEEVVLGDPIAEQNLDGDRGQYARDVAEAIRVSFGPSLLAAVPHEDRAAIEHELFTDRLTAAIEQDVAVGFDWRLAIMMLSRRDAVGE